MTASLPAPLFPKRYAATADPTRYATSVGRRPTRSTSHAALK
jgi:hypothetical protein